LIDNDVSADEIKSTFKSDSDIKKALASYIEDHDDVVDQDDDEEYEDDFEDNDDY
jgi:hypothetical protein